MTSIRQALAGRSVSTLVLWAIALAGGAYLGYVIAYSANLPGLGSISALIAGLLAVAILTALVVIAVVAALLPGKRGRPAARAAISVGVMLALGVGAGWAITSALGLGYHEPVLLESRGTANLSLDGIEGYVGRGDALAFCRSETDAENVAHLETNLVGNVGTGMVAATLSLQPDSSDGRPEVQIAILPANKTQSSAAYWQGPADVVERLDGDRGGRIRFEGVPLLPTEEGGGWPEVWPTELSGTLTWSCGDWSRPNAEPGG